MPADPLPDPADAISRQIGEIYRQVLGRNPDSEGLATYSAALAGGTSLASIRAIIANSQEARSHLNGLYHQIFGRDADAGASANGNSRSMTGTGLIEKCADNAAVVYADIGGVLLDAKGRLTLAIAADQLHFSALGYARLAPRLDALIDGLLAGR